MNHADILLEFLKKHKKATGAEIYAKTGIWRVSDAVFKLRIKRICTFGPSRPPEIKTTMITVKNRRKESVRVAEYSLGR